MLKYLDELKALDLPEGQYAIFGSGPLAVRNLRDSNDIDIIVTENIWQQLSKSHDIQTKETNKGTVVSINIGNIEIYKDWLNLTPKISEMIDQAETINDLPFVRLEYVIEWKKFMGRDKDKNDLLLIDKFLGEEKNNER